MATLFDGIGANGFSTGFAMGNQVRKQRGLESGVKAYVDAEANGDKAGMQKALGLMSGVAPVETMNWLKDKGNSSWTTDVGRMWGIAHDPNASQEDKELANQYLRYTAKDPMANQSWTQAGRIGQLQGDLALAGQVEAEKKKATQAVEKEIDEAQLKRQAPIAMKRINNLKEGLEKDDSGIGPIAGKTPWTSQAGYDNRANVRNAQAQINTAMRGLLKSMGVGSTELNSAVEAEAYRYMINQDMPKGQILKVLDNFEKDFMSGRLEEDLRSSGYGKTNNVKNKNSKYVIEEVIE